MRLSGHVHVRVCAHRKIQERNALNCYQDLLLKHGVHDGNQGAIYCIKWRIAKTPHNFHLNKN